MKLSTDTWHYRNFRAWQRHSRSQRLLGIRSGYRDPDLCTYMRIALIWGPLRRFWSLFDRYSSESKSLTVIILLIYALVAMMAPMVGEFSLWYILLIIPVGYIAMLALGVALGMIVAWPVKKLLDLLYRDRDPKRTGVVKEYIKARKQRICPIIEFEDQ